MYYHVVKDLFNENPQLFLTSDLKEYLPITTDESELRTPLNISDNYFTETNLDSNGKFRRIKRILTVFEMKDELSLKYQ